MKRAWALAECGRLWSAFIPMSILVIRDLSEEVHERLKRRADQHRRSLNAEAIAVLEAAVGASEARALACRDGLAAVFAAGDELATHGADFALWAEGSAEVWR